MSVLQYRVLESLFRLTVLLHKVPSIFNFGLVFFLKLELTGSRLGLMIFHKMSPRTHHNYL